MQWYVYPIVMCLMGFCIAGFALASVEDFRDFPSAAALALFGVTGGVMGAAGFCLAHWLL